MKKGFVDINFAKLDIDRAQRRGFGEIIYGEPKTVAQLKKIITTFKQHSSAIFISRLKLSKYRTLKQNFKHLKFFAQAQLGFLGKQKKIRRGYVIVVTAGTSDIPVAEEAAVFLELSGNYVERIYDVGVAGVHRLNHFKDKLRQAKVIIVIAGMEAALASVVSGLTAVPIIAVPTSVGYGASFKGLAALLGMLNSCSPGIGVVNIDNGLGAGYLANMINK